MAVPPTGGARWLIQGPERAIFIFPLIIAGFFGLRRPMRGSRGRPLRVGGGVRLAGVLDPKIALRSRDRGESTGTYLTAGPFLAVAKAGLFNTTWSGLHKASVFSCLGEALRVQHRIARTYETPFLPRRLRGESQLDHDFEKALLFQSITNSCGYNTGPRRR